MNQTTAGGKNSTLLQRRDWLKKIGLGGAALAAGSLGVTQTSQAADAPAADRKRAIRFAHLTDVHVEPELSANHGMAACLNHVQSQKDKPEFLLFGGDCVFDSMATEAPRVQMLWDMWKTVLKDNSSLPAEFGLGNHDVFGWSKKKAKTTGQEPHYGKAWAMEMLGLSKPYHSFDKAGWHFIVLDSISPFEDHYQGKLDEEQFAWLGDDLKKVDPKTPVLIQTHIPIFSVTPMVPPEKTDSDDTTVSASTMHADFRKLRALFHTHSNIKLCLSGHTHLIDRVDSNGITYICDGAVSGNWWKGNHLGECEPGYGLIDLYTDGTFDHRYVEYGWKADAAGV